MKNLVICLILFSSCFSSAAMKPTKKEAAVHCAKNRLVIDGKKESKAQCVKRLRAL